MRGQHEEVLQVAASSIMARHDAADELAINFANEAQARISLQIPTGRFT
jgi:hypothetical protein